MLPAIAGLLFPDPGYIVHILPQEEAGTPCCFGHNWWFVYMDCSRKYPPDMGVDAEFEM
jgi:hypothetical protein